MTEVETLCQEFLQPISEWLHRYHHLRVLVKWNKFCIFNLINQMASLNDCCLLLFSDDCQKVPAIHVDNTKQAVYNSLLSMLLVTLLILYKFKQPIRYISL